MRRKTADLTVVQRTLVDTQEDMPQKVITKRAGCSQSAVSKHNHGKLTGIEKCGGKGAGEDCQAKPIQEFQEFYSE